ncbi:hypothetical protein QZM68_29575 [Burkholderia gladioli]|uniref:hypothetical protein n=1 Tax=Burkholderia gladioli TaxID=28095 RepID=UPI002656656F|nr:hypothetical protein [Burkholderia gladioli]MDN7603916.1 hypothetical protein [Burkholderia gladioli]
MKQNHDPSSSEEISDMESWERSFWLARAYMEASLHLCRSMLDGGFSSQYSSSRVVLHLARQGIELFLKGALIAHSQTATLATHNIQDLYLKYRKLYRDKIFDIDIPPRFFVSPNFDLFPDTLNAFHATLDQRHRYAADRQGNTFATKEIFEPKTTLAELELIDRQLKIVEWSYIRQLTKEDPQ